MTKTVVIDYGIGNLHSVIKALNHEGGSVEVTSEPKRVVDADRVVLPGVGAFPDGMRALCDRGLDEGVKSFLQKGRPFLGICLGMQLLLSESDEFGVHGGLDVIPGRVEKIEPGASFKVPHVGWTSIAPPRENRWEGTMLGNIPSNSLYYFVHSFAAVPSNSDDRLADAMYGKSTICAALQRGHITGLQFHPEKSSLLGLNIVRNFLSL